MDLLSLARLAVWLVSTCRVHHTRINSYRNSGSIKQFIRNNHEVGKDINDIIELSLDIKRHCINFKIPRYLCRLNQIVNDVFGKCVYALCDYSFYASFVESYFYPSYVVPFDEYGLSVQIINFVKRLISQTILMSPFNSSRRLMWTLWDWKK